MRRTVEMDVHMKIQFECPGCGRREYEIVSEYDVGDDRLRTVRHCDDCKEERLWIETNHSMENRDTRWTYMEVK